MLLNLIAATAATGARDAVNTKRRHADHVVWGQVLPGPLFLSFMFSRSMHDRTLYATKERGRNAIGRLKIDRKFIRDVADGRDSASLVEGIMAMPRSLHLDCIAEGVESVGQVAYLWKLGCFQVQG